MLVLAQVASPAVVGQYALGLAIATPLNVFADRALRMLQATASDDDFPLGDYLALRCLLGAASLVIIVLMVNLWQLGGATGQVLLLVASARLVEGIAQVLYGRLQREQRMSHIGQSQLLRGFLASGSSLGCLGLWRRLDLALAAGVLANIAVILWLDRPRVQRLVASWTPGLAAPGIRVSWRHVAWAKMIRLALPLAMATFFVSLSINIPRLFLSRYASQSSLGIFAVLCYLCFPATMLVSAMMQAATPQLARLYREGPGGAYRQLFQRLLIASAAVAAANAWLVHGTGKAFVQMTLGVEYAAAAGQLDWIAAASGIGYLAAVPATAMNAQRLFRLSLLTCSISCGTACLVGAWLIPRFAMTGAALTMLLTSAAHLLLSCGALRWAGLRGANEVPSGRTIFVPRRAA